MISTAYMYFIPVIEGFIVDEFEKNQSENLSAGTAITAQYHSGFLKGPNFR